MKRFVRISKDGEVEMSPAAALGLVTFMFFTIAILPGLLGGR